uniref:CSON014540 protein n=1 Tax=Culicoides sonorensis TaxID=179676 RepID=A0A336KQL0_CULSO
MKLIYFALSVVLVAVVSAFPSEKTDNPILSLLPKIREECKTESGVSDEILTKLDNFEVIEDHAGKCFKKCLCQKAGACSEDSKVFEVPLLKALPHLPEAKVNEFVPICNKIVENEPCDQHYARYRCLLEHIPEMKVKLDATPVTEAPKERFEGFNKFKSECIEETGVSTEIVEKVVKHELITDHNGKCFKKCMCTKLGFCTKDYQLDIEAITSKRTDVPLEKLKAASPECNAIKTGTDECETMYDRYTCFLKHVPEIGRDHTSPVPKEKTEITQFRADCKNETGATDEIIDKILKHQVIEEHSGKCFEKCLCRKIGLCNDNLEYDVEAIKVNVPELPYDKLKEAAPECNVIKEGSDDCEMIYNRYKCFVSHLK